MAQITETTSAAGLDRVWHKLLKGGAWLFAMRLAQRVGGTARMVVLARILSPDDFGVMAIALVIIGLVRQLSESGFKSALIQRDGDISGHLGTAWAVEILRGLLLATVVLAAAPLLATFFDAPKAVPVLRVLALALFLDSAKNIGLIYLQRNMAFNRYFVFNVIVTLADIVVSLVLVFIFRNVWALVLGYVAGVSTAFILSFIMAPWPPRPEIRGKALRELFAFGKWMTGSAMVGYFVTQLDKIVVGRVLGGASLGLYHMAYNISNMLAEEVSQVAGRAFFPAYSRMQNDIAEARATFLKLVQIMALTAIPAGIGLFLVAEGFTQYVLGEQWLPMVDAMQLLAILGILRVITQPSTQLLRGFNRPDAPAKFQALNLAVMAVCIYPFTRMWGLEGTVFALLAGAIVTQPLMWTYSLRLLSVSPREVANALSPALAGAVGIVIAVNLVGQLGTALPVFVGQIVAGGLAYMGMLTLWAFFFHWNPKHMLQ